MREIEFVDGEYYHIYNRGVDKRQIFLDDADRDRFCQSMFLFNDATYFDHGDPFDKIVRLSGYEMFDHEREPFVRILAYTLLPNHYHLLVEQLSKDGISKFFHKLNKGYSRYFNLRHERSGTLFEDRFKAKHLDSEAYANHLIPYIHLNILDLGAHDWRGGVVADWEGALKEMDTYEWSSHRCYRGIAQLFPLVDLSQRSTFSVSAGEYDEYLRQWSTRYDVGEIESELFS
jgi:putative transposase